MNYLGIDVSKKSHRCVILDSEGEAFCKSFTIENSLKEFQRLVDKLNKLGLTKDNLLSGVEATGNYWENLYTFLTEQGFKVVVLNPYQTNKFHQALMKKAKTDDIDAFVIAGLLRSNHYNESFVPEEIVQTLRALTKLRYELMKDRKNYYRQTTALLSLIFPEYTKTVLKNPFSKASTQVLKKYPTAKHIAQAKAKYIERIVRKIQGNNFNLNAIYHLIETAQKSIYSGRAQKARGLTLKILLEHIERLDQSIELLEQEIQETLNPNDDDSDFPGSNLFTIPGVGLKTIAAVLSTTGTKGEAFPTATHYIGYIGYFPKIHQSGDTTKDNKIVKRGPKYLRWALYMAAVASLLHNVEMRTLYYKKISQGKTKKQALVYVAKKLAHIMLSMLKSGQPYRPERVFVNGNNSIVKEQSLSLNVDNLVFNSV